MICTCMHTYDHNYIYACINITCTYIHAYIHKHTHAHIGRWFRGTVLDYLNNKNEKTFRARFRWVNVMLRR